VLRPIIKRILIGVVGLACLAVFAFVALIVFVMMPPLRSFSLTHEKLPAVYVETGGTVYCRMRYCDFRFPLPSNVHIVWTNLDGGGFDTINGAIYVVGTNGGPVNLRDYAEFLQKKHWNVSVGSGAGCEDVTNNVPDVPFVSSSGVIHYPLFEQMGAGSADQEGGGIVVETEDSMTKIRFSYFGDY
jgi:hypothetical protein